MPLLEVENLTTEFRSRGAVVHAVRGVSFHVERGETLGVVGESGSGKSVTALSIMGLVPSPPGRVTGGSVRLDGKDLLAATPRELQGIRGARMAMVFQDPFTCLNPTMTLGAQIEEPILLHTGASRAEARSQALALLQSVRIPSPHLRYRQYPHEISGGQRQRVMIAMAFACRSQLLIADEPTTALDVTVQAQILALMAELRRETNTGILLITHDMGVVAESCDRVLVMYAGRIVESGSVSQVLGAPKHPYTQGLLAAIPDVAETRRRLASIPGQPPDLAALPPGCPFAPRCPSVMPQICTAREPGPAEPLPGQHVRCYLYGEGA
ncbi:MAG TPA: ABC transporter ATP-binding protein [Chthonomonadaceae bacterium]|nr:ABC transporter ATP-binding protein [Chthonomonadaceae bacterium]